MELFKKLNQQGTTIVQVTHSEINASYGNRTIQLFDGWIVNDPKNPSATKETTTAVATPESR
jgi:ABC-type lipoprotein export system ATPase subunit